MNAMLTHDVLVLGALFVLTVVLALACSRLISHALVPWLSRFVEGEGVPEAWGAWMTRLLVLGTILFGVCLLGAAVLLSWYELDTAQVVGWIEHELPRDPVAIACGVAVVVLVALALDFGLRRAVPRVVGGLARLPRLAGREDELGLLHQRVHTTLRWIVALGALLVCVRLVTGASEDVRAPVVAVAHTAAFVIIGLSIARAIVAIAHILVDVAFELSKALAANGSPLRLLGHLQGLTKVTKRVLDLLVYVGVATIIVDQVTPGTAFTELGAVVIRAITILYVARVIVEVCDVGVREALAAAPHATEVEQQQRQTLAPIATSLIRYAIYIVAIAMALAELGLDTSPLLAAAGLLGIAIGLGAQAIVSDLVSGFFILFEGMFLVGHRVQIGEVLGEVEGIGVRVTQIRDEHGVLHSIPNGEIREVANHSQRFVKAVVEFGVPFEEPLPRVFEALRVHLEAIRARFPDILDDSELQVAELRESCVWMRVVTPVKPGQDDRMSELLRIEIVTALADAKVAPPHTTHLVRAH